MISFKQLTESLNSSYLYKLSHVERFPEGNDYIYDFEAKSGLYQVRMEVDNDRMIINVLFVDEEMESSLSGKAGVDAVRVFATVGRITEDIHKKYPKYGIRFSATNREPSRVKLYKILANRIATKMNGQMHIKQGLDTVTYSMYPKE